MSAKKKAKAKAGRKPTELNQANLAKVASALKGEFVKVKSKDQSKCEALRKVAKRLGSVRRIEIEAVATKAPFSMNVATVRTQIQAARA